MTVWNKTSNRYDASSGQITMGEKDVTLEAMDDSDREKGAASDVPGSDYSATAWSYSFTTLALLGGEGRNRSKNTEFTSPNCLILRANQANSVTTRTYSF